MGSCGWISEPSAPWEDDDDEEEEPSLTRLRPFADAMSEEDSSKTLRRVWSILCL